MCVNNPDPAPVAIYRSNATPTPTGFGEKADPPRDPLLDKEPQRPSRALEHSLGQDLPQERK
jgi:hypothetical protein